MMRPQAVGAVVGACGGREVGVSGWERLFVMSGIACARVWCAVCEGLLCWLQAGVGAGAVHVECARCGEGGVRCCGALERLWYS